jgi:hypothetical protein
VLEISRQTILCGAILLNENRRSGDQVAAHI